MKHSIIIFCLIFLSVTAFSQNGKVLFDNLHAQRAGSADWVIDGGYSDFADTIKNNGYLVNSQDFGKITMNILKEFDVFIIPEPNNPFSSDEIAAIKEFVKKGGGLLLIADHKGADRNGNGYDAIKIYNQFVEEFGFKFDQKTISEHPLTGSRVEHDAIKGVYDVGTWAGTTMSITDSAKAKGLIHVGKKYGSGAYIVAAGNGKGRVIAIGDSSPFDDGTKASGSSSGLHDNYNMTQYHHHVMASSFVRWLCQSSSAGNNSGDDDVVTNDGDDTNDTGDVSDAPLYDEMGRMNVNVATKEQLDSIYGIGKSTAEKIVNFRNLYGKFSNIAEIAMIPGITSTAFNVFKDKICAL